MRRCLVLALVLALPSASLPAQAPTGPPRGDPAADREGVRRAALEYLEGFYEGDSSKFMRGVRPEFYKSGFWWARDSTKYLGDHMSWDEALTYIRRVKQSGRTAPATAPKQVDIYEVLDKTASAKVTAFWGIDYLLLGKYGDKWMISHVLWQSPPPKAAAP